MRRRIDLCFIFINPKIFVFFFPPPPNFPYGLKQRRKETIPRERRTRRQRPPLCVFFVEMALEMPVFVDTSLGTRLALSAPGSITARDLKRE